MIKVLVVDDSAFMRNALSKMLSDDPNILVVGTARNGEDALEKVQSLNPDLITLDVEMPIMDGLTMLEKLMKTNPKPVIMVSSLTHEGAQATLKALDLGALDFIPKYQETGLTLDALQKDLITKVKAMAPRGRFMRPPTLLSQKPMPSTPSAGSAASAVSAVSGRTPFSASASSSSAHNGTLVAPPPARSGRPTRDMVAIGVSTGGPPAVQKVLSALPTNFPACILIAQHMPASFTAAFAKRLDSVCQITVKEAETGDKLAPGFAYVAPGGQHIRVDSKGPIPMLTVTPDPVSALYKPSATVLFESVGMCMGRRAVGVTMTGMGSDGCDGTRVLKAKGGYIIAQNEASCVVYGMPKAVVDAGLADEIIPVDDLASVITSALYR